MLQEGNWFEIAHISVTALVGVYLLSCSVQGWFMGHANGMVRIALAAGGLTMIAGGWVTDAIGVGIAVILILIQKGRVGATDFARGTD
jgi:TRAP-type uncharacterized transport system fused permease subunit